MDFPSNKFTGYVLAGGESSRMGRDKAFLEIGGKTLLNNSADVLESVCGNGIKVSLNRDQEHLRNLLPETLTPIFDIYKGRGPLGGIHAALEHCETEFAAVLAVDLPLVTREFLREMALESEVKNVGVTVPRLINGKYLPLCGIFRPGTCLAPLETAFEQHARLSVRGFLKTVSIYEIETRNKSQFLNANTPGEFESIKKTLDLV